MSKGSFFTKRSVSVSAVVCALFFAGCSKYGSVKIVNGGSGYSIQTVSISNADGLVVDEWTTIGKGQSKTYEDLEPGTYAVLVADDGKPKPAAFISPDFTLAARQTRTVTYNGGTTGMSVRSENGEPKASWTIR